ncbi:MAG: right-handed parallel beta-helix repeat-containing protein [Phycisphaerales bacterium]
MTSMTSLMSIISSPAHASVIQVPAGQPTLKAAIAAAVSGDEIVVADGVYTGADNRALDFGGKNLFLHSANGPAACIIDCELAARGFEFQSGETAAAIVEGFTIRHGKPAAGTLSGGAIFIHGAGMTTGPTVRHCTFEANTAGAGGAIAAADSANPTVVDCTFVANAATSSVGNSGGGGIQLNGAGVAMTIEKCTFEANTAPSGGGVYSAGSSLPTINGCTFIKNTATSYAGAISLSGPSVATVWNCRFFGNNGPSYGGAIAIVGTGANPSIVNCVFSGNSVKPPIGLGGAVMIQLGSAQILNCTMVGNAAGGPSFGSAIAKLSNVSCNVQNCVLWGNAGAPILDSGTNPIVVAYSIVQGGFAGAGNSGADPLIVDADGPDNMVGTPDDDLRVSAGSPAIDSGSNPAWNVALTTDVAGNLRFYDDPAVPDGGAGTAPIIDRGAYESQPAAPTCDLADLDCDGDVDGGDLGLLLGAWGSNNPDADLDGDGLVGGGDLGIMLGAWTG